MYDWMLDHVNALADLLISATGDDCRTVRREDITVFMILSRNDLLCSMPYDSLALDPRRMSTVVTIISVNVIFLFVGQGVSVSRVCGSGPDKTILVSSRNHGYLVWNLP